MAKITDNDIRTTMQRYGIIGSAPALINAVKRALIIAPIDISVLINGENGTGKEFFPKIIHDNSPRKHKKYIAVNCGAIPAGTISSELFGHEKGSFTNAEKEHAGYFEVANGGTIFLDEVADLTLDAQARLLRVLESGEYLRVGSSEVRKTNVRVVAATNVNIQMAIRDGRFREDLFYRLNTIPIKMPPLRERGDDILLLFKKFAMEIAAKYQMPERITLSPEAEEVMKRYKWPGNIRQLKNLTEQMSILMRDSRVVTPDVLSDYEIWPTIEENGGLVRVGHTQGGTHSYDNEREMLFQMINALHREVSDLKQQLTKMTPAANGSVHVATNVPVTDAEVVPIVSHSHIQQQPIVGDHHTNAHDEATPYAEEYVEESLSIDEQEKRLIIKALEKNRGRRKKAAEELHISERTLYRKIKEYGLEEN